MQAKYGEAEISALLLKVRIFNKGLGSYQMFAITENFDYVVKLTNGKILFKLRELEEDEKDILTPEQLSEIAGRFISDETDPVQEKPIMQTKDKNVVQNQELNKNNPGLKIVLSVITGLIIIGILISVYSDYEFGGGNYEQKKMSVREMEESRPTQFLSASGTYRQNFFGDKFIVNCTITNNASVATYKDVSVNVRYYSKTKTQIAVKTYTLYEIFPPNSTKTVKLKIDNYNNVYSIGWDVLDAEVY